MDDEEWNNQQSNIFHDNSSMSSLSVINSTNASDSEYDVSAGTIAKVNSYLIIKHFNGIFECFLKGR